MKIGKLTALEILDSRGRPTLQATCELDDGTQGTASVPSGVNVGTAEALELRDGDVARYHGLGCRKATAFIEGNIQAALVSQTFRDHAELDGLLLALDGTANKSRLGANTLLVVSLAVARASAAQRHTPLYEYFAEMMDVPPQALPRPMIHLFSGGKRVEVQEVQVMPLRAGTIDEALSISFAIYSTAAALAQKRYGAHVLRSDEGGLVPPFASVEAMLEVAVEAIEAAGFTPGVDVALTLDVGASHFYHEGCYQLGGKPLDGDTMIRRLEGWLTDYPIVSMEDGLAEDDWIHWARLHEQVTNTLILGDDLLRTQPVRICQAIERRAANALVLKVNQIGTLTEAAEACILAKSAGWWVVVSGRSGETEDDWLADLAVGWGGDHIQAGSMTQSERLAKYNRLLAIERESGLPVAAFG